MENLLVINIEKKDKDTTYSMDDLYQELFYWLHYQVKKLCTGKANAPILFFISESTEDGWTEDDCINIAFDSTAGSCDMSENISLHWFTLVYKLLYPQLSLLFEDMGYILHDLDTSLSDLLEETIHHPVFKYKGDLYNICNGSDGDFELIYDNGVFDVSGLRKASITKIKEQLKERRCECSLCVKLRKGNYKLIDLKALKAKESEKTEYTTISSALRNPRSVKCLDIVKSSIKELPSDISKLVNLERLEIDRNYNLRSIPKELGDLKRLESLVLERNHDLISIPKELKNLKKFRLEYSNEIKELPVEFFRNNTSLESLRIVTINKGILNSEIRLLTRLKTLEVKPCNYSFYINLPKETGFLKNLERIDLTNISNKIPETIYECTNLSSMDLHCCDANPLPSKIGNLTKLDFLSLRRCNLKELPVTMNELINLEILDLSQNSLTSAEIDKIDFSRFKKMRALYFSETALTYLPKSIYKLKILKSLTVEKNIGLTEIDEDIQKLSNLESLILSETNITTLPESLGNLKKLKRLDLCKMQIQELPIAIKELKSLESLNLRNTDLNFLPEWLKDLPNLKVIDLRGCSNAKQIVNNIKFKPKFYIDN